MFERINKVLEQIRPYLLADGGNVILENVTDDMVVEVKLTGSCVNCPFSKQTLKAGVEEALKREIPEVKEVVAVN